MAKKHEEPAKKGGDCNALRAAMRGKGKSQQQRRKAFAAFAKAGCLRKGKKGKGKKTVKHHHHGKVEVVEEE